MGNIEQNSAKAKSRANDKALYESNIAVAGIIISLLIMLIGGINYFEAISLDSDSSYNSAAKKALQSSKFIIGHGLVVVGVIMLLLSGILYELRKLRQDIIRSAAKA